MSEDNWVRRPMRKIVQDMQGSLAAYPSVPFGALMNYVPKAGPTANNAVAKAPAGDGGE